MDYRDRILTNLADRECKRISKKVISALRKMKQGMQSGDGSPLKNIWDEVCVQAQYEESIFWASYLTTIGRIIEVEVNKLEAFEKQAIWLETEEGIEWACDNEDAETASFCSEDIVDYILHNFVLSEAVNWDNKRIEKYRESYLDQD